MKEIWEDIGGYEGLYQISNLGRVRSIKRLMTKGKILKLCCSGGYYYVTLLKDRVKKSKSVHRLVGKAFLKKRTKPCINHKDGNKLNNRVENLEWCTYKENIEHAQLMGLFNTKGSCNGNSKLTESDVAKIRKLKGNIPNKEIAKKYRVGVRVIRDIYNKKYWTHVN